MGINLVVCKLYSNSLISSLNSRGAIRHMSSTTQSVPMVLHRSEQIVEHNNGSNGSSDTIPQVPEAKVGQAPGFVSANLTGWGRVSRLTAPFPNIGRNKPNPGSLLRCTVNLAGCKDERITSKYEEELVFGQKSLSTFGRIAADLLLSTRYST